MDAYRIGRWRRTGEATTLDCDSLDPGVMPGVAARTPGGLTYTQVIDLIAGLGKQARIAGFDLVEFYPPADFDGLSALTAARILVNVVGAVVRQQALEPIIEAHGVPTRHG